MKKPEHAASLPGTARDLSPSIGKGGYDEEAQPFTSIEVAFQVSSPPLPTFRSSV
jgi:hypothetical protein